MATSKWISRTSRVVSIHSSQCSLLHKWTDVAHCTSGNGKLSEMEAVTDASAGPLGPQTTTVTVTGHNIADFNGVYDHHSKQVDWDTGKHGKGTRVKRKEDGRIGVSNMNRDSDGDIKIKFGDGSVSSYTKTRDVWALDPNTDKGWPVMMNEKGKFCFRYAASDKWFLRQKFAPDEGTRNSEIKSAAGGSLPLGAQSWTCYVDGSDVQRTLTLVRLFRTRTDLTYVVVATLRVRYFLTKHRVSVHRRRCWQNVLLATSSSWVRT